MRLLVAGLLCVAAGSLVWSWTLQEDVIALLVSSEISGTRIEKLEGLLTSTGESMNESELAMQVKIKELYSEVDKLWASAWRRNKKAIADQGEAIEQLKKQTAGIATNKTRIDKLTKSEAELRAQLGDASRLAAALEEIRTQQGLQEAVIGRLTKELDNLSSRQKGIDTRLREAESWVDSNIEFRKQAQRRLSDLETRTGIAPGG